MRRAKLWLPLAILGAAVLGVAGLWAARPEVESRVPDVPPRLVRAQRAMPESVRFVVRTHGTVMPRTESELVPQVSGEVTWVSPQLASGGFFEAGEPLVRIERADYEAELESARAGVARATSERARAEKDLARQKRLRDSAVASEARIDDAENAFRVSEAALREARARLDRARRDLERTELRAPYDGRVRDERVDAGQFANRGTPLATLYAVDYAEVRLPVPDRELAYVDLPLGYREQADDDGPEVRLHAEFAGRDHTWTGRIVRTEGEIDPRSRMVHVVARVDDPYNREGGGARSPLAVGLFVEAEILGERVEQAFVLPREALREDGEVLVVDDEDRLRFRAVEVLRVQDERVVIGDGLRTGERVCVSPLQAPVPGMLVRVAGAPSGETPVAADPPGAAAEAIP